MHIPFIQCLVQCCFGNRCFFNKNFLGQGFGGVFFLAVFPEGEAAHFVCLGTQQTVFNALKIDICNLQLFIGECTGFHSSDFKIHSKHVILYILGNLLFIIIIKGFLDFLQNRVIVHVKHRFQKTLGDQLAQVRADFRKKIAQRIHINESVFPGISRIEFIEYFDGITSGKPLCPFCFRFGNDCPPPFCREPLSVSFRKPCRNVSGVYLHFEQLQVLVTIKTVFSRVGYPFQHGI